MQGVNLIVDLNIKLNYLHLLSKFEVCYWTTFFLYLFLQHANAEIKRLNQAYVPLP